MTWDLRPPGANNTMDLLVYWRHRLQLRVIWTYRDAVACVAEQCEPSPAAQGGEDGPESFGKHPDLLPPPDNQRRSRRTQQKNSGRQTEGRRLTGAWTALRSP